MLTVRPTSHTVTQYYCTQYRDKKIKSLFDKKIFFSSKYCIDILKSFQTRSLKNLQFFLSIAAFIKLKIVILIFEAEDLSGMQPRE